MELRNTKINKKGFTDFTGLFFALAVIFGIAIFLIILSYSYNRIEPKINEGLTNAATPDANTNVTKILSRVSSTITNFNVLFPLLMIGVFAFVMIVALMDTSHPVFFFIGIIVLMIAMLLAAIYSNVYSGISSNSNFATEDSKLNIVGFVLDNLPAIILILFVLIAIILFGRQGGSQGI